MKVLMFGWEFPPHHNGGLGVACYGLTKALSENGVEVLFVLPKKLDIEHSFLKILYANIPSAKIIQINSNLVPYITSDEYKKSSGKYSNSLIEEVKTYAAEVNKIIQDEDFDIIHSHDWLTFLPGIVAQEFSQKPFVTHVHATEFERCAGLGKDYQVAHLEEQGVTNADQVITVSNTTKNILQREYDLAADKIEVVYNGIDFSPTDIPADIDETIAFFKNQGKKVIIYLGRFTLAKCPDNVIRTFKKVTEVNPDTILLMVGDGEMKHQLIDLASCLGISDKVLFTGWVKDDHTKFKLYKSADVFVMPSVYEPFGLVSLEALMNDTPIIISKQSGVSEVVSHALKVDFWDINDMANKIVSVLNHKSLFENLTVNGKSELTRLTWDRAAKSCIGIYEKLLHF